jgi:hypothetical protein
MPAPPISREIHQTTFRCRKSSAAINHFSCVLNGRKYRPDCDACSAPQRGRRSSPLSHPIDIGVYAPMSVHLIKTARTQRSS